MRADSMAAAFDLLRTGRAEAHSSVRPLLVAESARLAGCRVLEDGFGVIFYAALVPKGKNGGVFMAPLSDG